MTRTLQRAKLDVESTRVSTEAELSEALRHSTWSLVLSCYPLPGLNVPRALRLVREAQPDLPFIVVSEAVGEEVAAAAIKAGADDFVLKRNLARLVPAVHRGLRDAAARRELRRSDVELHDSKARFRSIIENVGDVILVLDPAGRVHYQSPSAERVFGHRLGSSLFDHLHPCDQDAVRAVLNDRSDRPRSPLSREFRLRHKDGTWRILDTMFADAPQHGGTDAIICNLRDVTERKHLESSLFRAERLESLGGLAGGIAHDLNNLLTPIMMASELLADVTKGQHKDLLDGLHMSAVRATDLVRHLMSFAQGVKGGPDAFAPEDLIRDLEQMLRFGLPKTIALRTSTAKGLWPIVGDATQILQVLVNLCVNARDAMPRGGRLTVHAQNLTLGEADLVRDPQAEAGTFVEFQVTDTGVGIAREDQERVFKPFYSTKGPGRGTGLGLSTTLRIVRGHGGLIRISSDVGRGARFSVCLPTSRTTSTALRHRELDIPRGDGELVMVVDDEVSVREIAREALEAYGYDAVIVGDGAEALAFQDQGLRRAELAIVDMTMPLMDGPATVRALRQADPAIRILVQRCCGSADGDAYPAGADGVLEKPYTVERLLRAVAASLTRDRANAGADTSNAVVTDHR